MPLILAVRKSAGNAGEPIAPLRLDRGEIVIGRGTGAHLMLPFPSVSRRHCTISGEGQSWHLADSSSGGTFVNGRRISAIHMLHHGDVIRVGETEIAVMFDAGQAQVGAMQGGNVARDAWGRPGGGVPGQSAGMATQVPGVSHVSQAGAEGDAAGFLLQAAGLSRGQVGVSDQQVLAVAGAVLKAALGGLTRLALDRRKAREDLGAGGTGGSDLAQSGSAEEMLLRLLSLPPDQVGGQVSALSGEIDAHQKAVLCAMQESFHHALDQFSPKSIKTNARSDAEAWKAYERAFDAKDGFVEAFAQAFSQAYARESGASKE